MLIRRIIEALRNLLTRFRAAKGPGATPKETGEQPTEYPRGSNPVPPRPISVRPSNQKGPDSLSPTTKHLSNANPQAAAPTPPHTTNPSSPDQSGQEKTEGSLSAASGPPPVIGTDPSSEANTQSDSSDASTEPGNSSSQEETRVATDPASSRTNQQPRRSQPTHDMHPQDEGPNEDEQTEPHSAEEPSAIRPPRKIGSRRARSFSTPKPKERQASVSLPELSCRMENGIWQVFVSSEEDCRISGVHLNGLPLNSREGEYRLPSLKGRVRVSLEEGRKYELPLFKGDPLIFKLREGWSGIGRRIPRITKGHFIVLAPVIWERTGRAPVEAEHCADREFRAHYFYRNNQPPLEDSGGFREWEGQTIGENVIKLAGNAAYDNSDEGELFVGEAPSLETPPGIEWVRVGQEEERGWGANFQPNEESLSATLNGREGRFFLRIYDSSPRLMDSEAFRCSSGLKEIQVNGQEYTERTVLMPPPSGYDLLKVRFVGADGKNICPVVAGDTSHSTVRAGILEVSPHPDADRIECFIGSGTRGVAVVLQLPRIWWRLEQEGEDRPEWSDKPIVMDRQVFDSHARKNAKLAVLSKRFQVFRIGFDDDLDRKWRRKADTDCFFIPLADFLDYTQISERLTHDAHLKIECAGKILPIIRISADSMPEIVSFEVNPPSVLSGETALLRWETRNANTNGVDISPAVGSVVRCGEREVKRASTTTFRLTLKASGHEDLKQSCTLEVSPRQVQEAVSGAMVKRSGGGGFREGKGFSQGEYEESGLTFQELRKIMDRHGCFIDTRRRTKHQENIDLLRRWRDT